MKKLLTMALLAITLHCSAQTDLHWQSETTETKYCQLTGIPKTLGSGTNIYLYPLQEKLDVSNYGIMMDALNYMASKGWEFVQCYQNNYAGQNGIIYILKYVKPKSK